MTLADRKRIVVEGAPAYGWIVAPGSKGTKPLAPKDALSQPEQLLVAAANAGGIRSTNLVDNIRKIVMNYLNDERRRAAIKNAKASSALSGFVPSAHGLLMYEKWIEGLDGNTVVASLIEHHRNIEIASGAVSDGKAKKNLLGLTDSGRLRNAEADISTLRMAELLLQ